MKPKNIVIVRAIRHQGLTIAEAAARYGVSRQWVHTLLTRYDTEGPDGLAPRSKAPHTRPRHHAGEMRHLGVGRAHSRAPVLLLIHDRDVTVSRLDTGDVIGEFTIDPAKDYQARNPATPA